MFVCFEQNKNLVHNEPTTLDGAVTDNSNTYQEASVSLHSVKRNY